MYKFIINRRFLTISRPLRREEFGDPSEWFPAARRMQRKIVLHVGPTNSGKTYSALERLRESSSGIYCGPLRLLAHEVYDRMNLEWKVPCNLITGEEQRRPLDGTAKHTASTVEMANLFREYDVAVLDEIQMISNPERGSAWTFALLGLQAREIHCCGEERAVDLLERIVHSVGDELEIRRYKRLNDLEMEPEPVAGLGELKRGDCVIAFSRSEIFHLKRKIESMHRFKCAVVYGALPPETRVKQAELFNNPENNYDVIVASDAVGMGLNLMVKRIIFSTTQRFNGKNLALLDVSAVKQIGGRAGRYQHNSIEASHPGLVSSFSPKDWKFVKECMDAPIIPLDKACLSPTLEMVEQMVARSPKKSFAKILRHFERITDVDDKYFLGEQASQCAVADAIQHIPLSVSDRYSFINAPVKAANEEEVANFIALIHGYSLFQYRDFSSRKSTIPKSRFSKISDNGMKFGDLDVFRRLLNTHGRSEDELVNFFPEPVDSKQLSMYEQLHRLCILYLWLHYRHPSVYPSLDSCSIFKNHIEGHIHSFLQKTSGRKSSRFSRI